MSLFAKTNSKKESLWNGHLSGSLRLGVVFLLVGASIFFWRGHRKSPQFPRDVLLNDGSSLRILRMEYGTNFFLTNLTFWQSVATRMPPKLRPATIKMPPSFGLAQPSLVMFYQDHKTNTGETLSFLLGDAKGFFGKSGDSPRSALRDGTSGVKYFSFPNFPRRSDSLKMVVYTDNQFFPSMKAHDDYWISPKSPFSGPPTPVFLGKTSLRNDWISKSTPWLKQNFVDSNSKGDLQVRLKEVTCYLDADDTALRDFSGFKRTALKFEVQTRNLVDTNWEVVSVESDTSSGNHHYEGHIGSQVTGDRIIVHLLKSLWLDEPVHYRVELGRAHHFPSHESWIIPNINIPRERFWSMDLMTNLMGQKIIVEGFADKGVPRPWQAGEFLNPELCLTTPSIQKGMRIKMDFAMDDKGRELQIDDPDSSDGKIFGFLPRGDKHPFVLFYSSTAESVTVKLGLQRSLWLDFIVQPRAWSARSKRTSEPAATARP